MHWSQELLMSWVVHVMNKNLTARRCAAKSAGMTLANLSWTIWSRNEELTIPVLQILATQICNRGSHPTLACWHCRIPCVSERPFVKKSWGLWDICELPPDLWNIKRNYEIWRAPIFYRSGWMKFKNVLAWHENNNHARWNRRAKGFCAVQRTYSCSVNSNRTGYKSLSSTMRGHADGNSS